jgi:hypothetical protein
MVKTLISDLRDDVVDPSEAGPLLLRRITMEVAAALVSRLRMASQLVLTVFSPRLHYNA